MKPLKHLISLLHLIDSGELSLPSLGKALALKTGLVSEARLRLRKHSKDIFLRNNRTDWIVFSDVLVYKSYQFSLLETAPTCILDAGANIGISTLYFADLFPDARIIGIEPDEENFRRAQLNTRGLKNVHLIHGALTNQSGCFSIANPEAQADSYQVSRVSDQSAHVRGWTVLEIMKEFGVDRLGLMKIDIEGGEAELFSESQSWISKVDRFAIEFHDTPRNPCSRVFFDSMQDQGPYTMGINGENIIIQRVPGAAKSNDINSHSS